MFGAAAAVAIERRTNEVTNAGDRRQGGIGEWIMQSRDGITAKQFTFDI